MADTKHGDGEIEPAPILGPDPRGSISMQGKSIVVDQPFLEEEDEFEAKETHRKIRKSRKQQEKKAKERIPSGKPPAPKKQPMSIWRRMGLKKDKGNTKGKEDEPDKTTEEGDSANGDFELNEEEEEEKIEEYVIKKRQEMEKENREQRRFLFSISNIRVRFVSKNNLGNIFCEFEVGGQQKEVESEEVEEKKVKKDRDTGDGKKETFETTIAEPKKQIRVIRKPSRRYYTRIISVSITGDNDEAINFRNHGVSGEWNGSYNDLKADTLTVRVWHRRPFGANILIGTGSEDLRSVAKGKVDREVYIFKRREEESARKEAICLAYFKLELEELFDFHLKFQDLEMALQPDPEPLFFEDFCACGAGGENGNRPPLSAEMRMPNTKIWLRCFPVAIIPFFGECSAHLWMTYHHDKWNSRDKLGNNSKQAHLHYYGTRSKLENDRIGFRFYKGHMLGWCCFESMLYICRGPNMGEFEEPLQGKLDYGYIVHRGHGLINRPATVLAIPCLIGEYIINCFRKPSKKSKLRKLKNKKNERKATSDNDDELPRGEWGQVCTITNFKAVIQVEKEPRYRQLGNVGRPTGESKFLKFLPLKRELYLAIKIVRVKGLVSLAEYKETLSPSVSIDWAQTRRETRVVRDEPEPFFDEWLYFRVPRLRDQRNKIPQDLEDFGPFGGDSKILIKIWDNSAFSKRPLGFCEVDFKTIYLQRKQKIIESPTQIGMRVSRYVFHGKKLKLKEPKLKKELKDARPPNFPLGRGIEIMAFFDMGSNIVGPPRRGRAQDETEAKKYKEELERKRAKDPFADPDAPLELYIDESQLATGIPKERAPPVTDKRFKQAREFWVQNLAHVFEANSRSFAFCGIDEYSGDLYYLPSFVSAMVPPSTIKKPSETLRFIHAIELTRRKTGRRYRAARRTMARLGGEGDLAIWADPWTFLDQRRGDHRDHALLLCNFLLGQKQDAYVALGRVRVEGVKEGGMKKGKGKLNGYREEEHVWVITLEDVTDEDDKLYPFPQTVRFWETSTGRTFTRMNPPRTQVDWQVVRRKTGEAKEIKEEELLRSNLDFGLGENDINNITGVEEKKEDDNLVPDYSVDQSKVVSRIEAERARLRFRHQLKKGLAVSKGHQYQTWLANWKTLFSANWKDDMEEAPPIHEHQDVTPYVSIDVIFNDEDLYANLQAKNPHDIQYDVLNPNRWRRFKGQRKPGARDNTKDIKKTETEGGGEQYFWSKGAAKQFYPDRTMVAARAPEEAVQEREKDLLIVLQGALQAYRQFESLETTFLEHFKFQENLAGPEHTALKYIKKRLELEFRLEGDQSLMLKELEGVLDHEDDLVIQRKLWHDEITAALPEGEKMMEMIFHFKHADVSRISDQVIGRTKRLLHIKDNRKPRFGIGVKIHRMPGGISPVRVMVCCIAKQKKV